MPVVHDQDQQEFDQRMFGLFVVVALLYSAEDDS